MKEQEVEKIFNKYKNKLIRKFGRIALDTDQINNECRGLFGKKYKGCYAQDEKFPLKAGFYIINTDLKEGEGIHWCSLVIGTKNCYLYDSFARDPKIRLPHLVKRLSKYKFVYDERDAEQKAYYKNKMVVTCGQNCIGWLMIVNEYGIRNGMKVYISI